MALAGIRLKAIPALVRGIVQFDGRDHTGVWIQDQKVEGQLADTVQDRIASPPALEVQDLQELHLRKNDMLRQALNQPLVQGALTFREDVSLGLQRPGLRKGAGSRLELPNQDADHDGGDQYTYIESQMRCEHAPYYSLKKYVFRL
jgi:hypothetical protein